MNYIDISVLVVIGLSTLLALSRGFVKEMLSILSWVGATIATIFLFSPALPYVAERIEDELLAKIATAIGLFVVSLFTLGFLNHFISSRVQKSSLGALDRSLGLVFGLARGALVVALAHIAMTMIFPDPKERPDIVKTARTEPYAAIGADYLRDALPPEWLEKGGAVLNEGIASAEKGKEAVEAYGEFTNTDGESPEGASVKQDGQGGETGYKDAERKDADRLFQSTQ